MNLKRMRDAIGDAAKLVGAAGSPAAANDLKAIGGILDGPDDLPADVALQELETLLAAAKRLARESYAERLTRAGTDKAAFDDVHAALDKDKCISKEDANSIALAYTLGRHRWPTRKAALEAIRKKFAERLYQESKMRIVERSKVW